MICENEVFAFASGELERWVSQVERNEQQRSDLIRVQDERAGMMHLLAQPDVAKFCIMQLECDHSGLDAYISADSAECNCFRRLNSA